MSFLTGHPTPRSITPTPHLTLNSHSIHASSNPSSQYQLIRMDNTDKPVHPQQPQQPQQQGEFKHVQLKSLSPVATWSWVLEAEQCSICRNSLMSVCMKCQAAVMSGQSCSVVWGKCNHAFHSHCIQDWITTRPVCPIDEKPWSERQRAAIV